jgi:hypothetical protein
LALKTQSPSEARRTVSHLGLAEPWLASQPMLVDLEEIGRLLLDGP